MWVVGQSVSVFIVDTEAQLLQLQLHVMRVSNNEIKHRVIRRAKRETVYPRQPGHQCTLYVQSTVHRRLLPVCHRHKTHIVVTFFNRNGSSRDCMISRRGVDYCD